MRGLGLSSAADLVARDFDDLERTFVSRGGTFDAAVAPDGHVAGCAGVEVIDNETCRLRAMYVEAALRGRGVGRRLLERMMAFARSRRFRRMELDTSSVMTDAIALYTLNGFEREPRTACAQGCDVTFARSL
jgi:putative acetyltransferase